MLQQITNDGTMGGMPIRPVMRLSVEQPFDELRVTLDCIAELNRHEAEENRKIVAGFQAVIDQMNAIYGVTQPETVPDNATAFEQHDREQANDAETREARELAKADTQEGQRD